MQTVFRFSSVDKINGFTSDQSNDLKKVINNGSTITFIASSFNNLEKNHNHKEILLNFFSNIGIYFADSNLIDNSVVPNDAVNYIKNSDVVFLMGGDPKDQMNSIRDYDLIEAIRETDGVVIGVSAGAINLGSNALYEDDGELIKYNGIGLDDTVIYPHFDFDNFDFVKEVLRVSKNCKIMALENDAYLKIENGVLSLINGCYEFEEETFLSDGYPVDKINHLGTITLETDRMILRKQTIEDVDDLFLMQLNPLLRNYMGPYKLGNNLDKNRKFSESLLLKYDDLDFYRWIMVNKENDDILGCIMLNMHDEKAKTAGIDYYLKHSEWSKGYMSEAMNEVMWFAFMKLDLNRIESSGAKVNPGTWKVMEKCGLQYEGERPDSLFYYYTGTQDMVLYGLSKDDYKNKVLKK